MPHTIMSRGDIVKHMIDAARRRGEPDPEEARLLTASLADDIADSVRSWQTFVPEQDASKVKLVVRTLQQYADSLHTPALEFVQRQRAYPVITMIRSVLMVSSLRSQHGDSLRRACLNACQILFSGACSSIWQEHLDSGVVKLPNSTTLSRHKLTLHVSWMSLLRELTRTLKVERGFPPVRYLTADASPQGGRGFMSAAGSALSGPDVRLAFSTFAELA